MHENIKERESRSINLINHKAISNVRSLVSLWGKKGILNALKHAKEKPNLVSGITFQLSLCQSPVWEMRMWLVTQAKKKKKSLSNRPVPMARLERFKTIHSNWMSSWMGPQRPKCRGWITHAIQNNVCP